MIKHSILMVTYNHKKYISNAIESIVNQSEQAYELIILDDYSTDNTYELAKNYSKKYEYIRLFRNTSNIGISRNTRKINSLAKGNVISMCAGDDYLDLDCIKNINDVYRANNIDPAKERAIVITNSAHHHEPTGIISHWNNYDERNIPLVKSRLRYSLSFRSVGYSAKLYHSMSDELYFQEKYNDLGLWYDYLIGFEDVLKVEKYFFVNKIGAYYRVNSGITSAKRDLNYWKCYKNIFKVLRTDYKEHFDELDLNYIDFKLSFCDYKLKPNFFNLLKSFKLLLKNKNNFALNNSLTRNLVLFLPENFLKFLKLYIYPLLLAVKKIKTRLSI
ncbi:MAG: glycosyltransferase family 2 protein [Flavobacteriaceae bacterium]|nr:glycosyltransferase family 2 protein [Flavobacteriaceae bacterium]MBL6679142.1 glycosyltransferase family 2 protein [Flavobacteriaceae bacterium]